MTRESRCATKNMTPQAMALGALFAVLTAVGAFLRVPLPFVPFTLQFFFCALAGVVLGSRLGAFSQILYVAMGLMGLPVFAGGGGLQSVVHPTFGYLLGFIAAAWVVGKLTERETVLSFRRIVGATLAGLGILYLVGVPWLWGVYAWYLKDPKPVAWAVTYGFLLFVGGDLMKSLLVGLVGIRLEKFRRSTWRKEEESL